MKRISFQGERGAYSEAASISCFEDEIETIPCSTFADALKNTEIDASDYSILPVENSLEGSVGESNDLLLSTNLNVVGEIYHRIHHCLIGIGSVGDIDTVYAQALAGAIDAGVEVYCYKCKLTPNQISLDTPLSFER